MQPGRSFFFGSFRLDTLNESLWHSARAISLTPKVFAVLRYLVEHAGRLVNKEELLRAVWPKTYVGDAVLKVSIREIRRALGDNPRDPQFIETVHRRGYRFIGAVSSSQHPEDSKKQARVRISGPEVQVSCSLAPRSSHPTPLLVGRETELEYLHNLLKSAQSGERQVVFVTGEAGIGKTTLIEAFLTQVTATYDFCLARGQCIEQYGSGEAYLPVLEALSRVCREPGHECLIPPLIHHAPTWVVQLPWLLGPAERERLQREVLGATQERMLREMSETVEALTTERAFVLVLEDLQWSDYATLDLITALARRRERARLLLIGTYRPVDIIVNQHPLRAVKQELQVHQQCVELPLDFLEETGVATYLAMRFPGSPLPGVLAPLLHRRTNGNPLFIVNVVDYLLAQGYLMPVKGQWNLRIKGEELQAIVPEGVRQMIEKQIERLNAQEQQVLEAASIAGTEFLTAAVAAALGADSVHIEDRCEELARRGQFIRPLGVKEWPDGTTTARYKFIHTLYQNVLYDRIAAARRLRCHQRIGERLEAAYHDQQEEVAAELAMHFEQAQDYSRTVKYLRQAAKNTIRRHANHEAISRLTRALELVERGPGAGQPQLRFTLREQLGLLRRSMGDSRGASTDFASLAAYARERGQTEWEVKALLYSASTLSWIDHERCLAAAERAVTLSHRLTNKELQTHARAYYGYWRSLLYGWQGEDAQQCAEAVELARRAGDYALLGLHVGRHLYFQCLQSTYRAACRTAEEELQVALAAGDAHHYLTCQFFRAWALLHLGQWGEMMEVLRDGEQIADKNQHSVWAMAFRLERAWMYEQACNFTGARELSEQGLRLAREANHQYGQLLSLTVLGRAYLGLKEYQRAFQHLSDIIDRPERMLMDWILRMPLCYSLSEYWLARRQFRLAQREAEQLCQLATQPGDCTYLALGKQMQAKIALSQRHWDHVETEISQALAILEGAEAPLAEWRVYATAAQLSQQRCRIAEASSYWTRSAAVLRQLADSLGEAVGLRHSLLSSPAVSAILRRAQTGVEERNTKTEGAVPLQREITWRGETPKRAFSDHLKS